MINVGRVSGRHTAILFGVVFSILIITGLAQPSHAKAAILHPDPGTGGEPAIPAANKLALEYCVLTNGGPYRLSPGYSPWVSIKGVPSATSTTVPYGTTSINLDYNAGATICRSDSAAVEERTLIVGVPVGVSGLWASQIDTPYIIFGQNHVSDKGFYIRPSKSFVYSPPGGFTSTGSYTLTVSERAINLFSNGVYQCVGPVGNTPYTSAWNFNPCATSGVNFTIFVNVGPKPTPPPTPSPKPTTTPKPTPSPKPTVTPKPTGTPKPTSPPTPTPTPAPTAFNLTPSSTVTLDDDEAPTNAALTAGIAGTGKANGVSVSRSYYYIKSGSAVHTPYNPSGPNDPPTVNFNGGTLPLATQNWGGVSGLSTGDKVCQDLSIDPVSGTSDASGNIVTRTSGPAVTSCVTIVAKPYFQVLGGDVSAGGAVPSVDSNTGYKSVCTTSVVTNSAAQIASWNQRAGGSYNGAAADYSVRAILDITDFVSAASVATPVGLTFANVAPATVNAANGNFGGSFGVAGAVPCDSSIVDDARTNTSAVSAATNEPGGAIPPVTATPGTNTYVAFGHDVYIKQNITTAPGSWTQPSDIPSFRLIVLGGNILIDPAVTQLDGLFYAAPDVSKPANSTGIIDTCQTQAGISDTQLYSTCNNKLVINGSFVAKKIRLRRTAGTLRTAGTGSSQNAEEFHYGPDMWLMQPTGGTLNSYSAVTGLPPVL